MKPRRRRRGKDRQSQNLLPQAIGEGWDPCATPWSGKIAVLVTSLDPQAHPASAMPRHYRERADAENAFDELKNQWGWGGYCSQRLSSSRLMANLLRTKHQSPIHHPRHAVVNAKIETVGRFESRVSERQRHGKRELCLGKWAFPTIH